MDGFIVGYAIAKAISGKYKPNLKNKRKAYIAIAFFIFMAFVFFVLGIAKMLSGDIFTGLVLFIGLFAVLFLIGISPWTQNPNNYRFEINEGEPIQNLRIYYKGKPVKVDFKVGKDGKIGFADDKNKNLCVRWADGSRMSQFTKYRIINAFTKHMADIDLLSEDTTATFE